MFFFVGIVTMMMAVLMFRHPIDKGIKVLLDSCGMRSLEETLEKVESSYDDMVDTMIDQILSK